MKVAMVSEHANPLSTLGGTDAGGQNVHVAELARALARQGNEVVVHTRRQSPHEPPVVQMADRVLVNHVDAGPPEAIPKDHLFPYMQPFARHLAQSWSAERPDVVHAHFWMSGWAALAAAEPLGLPVVQTFHALGNVKRRHQGAKDTSPPERASSERSIIERVPRIIATCTDEVFELTRLGADRRRITVVPCGVDTDTFSPLVAATSCYPRGRRHRIVVVSRLVERKGIGNVIEALAAVPDTELVVAGGAPEEELADDPEVARLHNLARAYQVSDRVRFLGSVDRRAVPGLLRSADIVVCAPWYEPFGMVVLEAQACGVPVIATAVGGHLDTIVDGVTGLLIPPRAPTILALALNWLLARPATRTAMGQAAAARARDRYRWDRIARATGRAYQRVTLPRPLPAMSPR